MKKLFSYMLVLILLISSNIVPVMAQEMPAIPVDKNVRIGQLENGLTYYIRHNALPENRVEFYIAQKVGSIQEEAQQRGLAHFLEHMCFNGTKNFPGDERGLGIVQWCESKGIKFGTNLNAYTSVDETVYNISNVPSTDQNVVDSCLLILHDWSSAVLLQDKEIDKERGVIHEEWRSRNSGIMRLYTEAQATMYPDSKYIDCMPIGNIDVIDNFPYQAIRDYYQKWYRPDLQGIIVVGDVDVDAIEAKIKQIFADIPAPVNAAERIYYPVPDNQEPLIYIGKDKEIDDPSIAVFFKTDATPREQRGSLAYLLQNYMLSMISNMLNARLSEIRQQATPPFISASGGYSTYFLASTKDAFQLSVSSKAEGITEALQATLVEVERMRRFGFTESEYERARANFLTRLESAYNEREKTRSENYVDEYVRHFLDNEPIPGIEYEYTIFNQVAPSITAAVINQVIQQGGLIPDNNQVVMIAAPDKEGVVLPTKEEVAAMLKGMKELDVTPYVDKVSNEPLMKEAPQGGKIVKEEPSIYGTTLLTLSNGIKVYLKPTDFKADEIRMYGHSWGGNSLFADEDALNFQSGIMNSVIAAGGVGNFSNTDLPKILAGKKVSISTSVGTLAETISGSTTPKDFETMLQLAYLKFTAPRMDQEAFASYKNRTKAALESAQANPLSSFNDSVTVTLIGNHPRRILMQPEMVDQLDYDKMMAFYKDRFANAGDFTFFFVGNLDIEAMKPLIAQYLGSLPTIDRKESWRDNNIEYRKGNILNEYAKEQETPMATIAMMYTGKCKYTLKNNILMSMLNQAFDMVFTEEIREKEGGTYGVSCAGQIEKLPREEFIMQVVYQTDPAKKDHLNGIIDKLVAQMAAEGPSEENLAKIKEYMLKTFKDNQKENSYWLNNLVDYHCDGIDNTKDYEAIVSGITVKDVQKFAKSLFEQGNKATIIMTVPEGN